MSAFAMQSKTDTVNRFALILQEDLVYKHTEQQVVTSTLQRITLPSTEHHIDIIMISLMSK